MSQVLEAPEMIQEYADSSASAAFDAPLHSEASLGETSKSSRTLFQVLASAWQAIFPQPTTPRECEAQKTEMAIDRVIRTDPYLYIMTMSR